jgi:bacterial/archaeal transporter family-2 protein
VVKSLAVPLAAIAGALAALQAPINATLGRRIGSLPASAFSFAVGTFILVVLAFIFGEGVSRLGQVRGLQWYYLLGGALGAFYVTTLLVTVRTLGAGALTACVIAGQLAMSVVVDRFGLLGIEKHSLSAPRIAGLALLAAGTFLVVRY